MELWLEIFRFATYVPASTSIAPMDPFTPESIHCNALGQNSPILSMRTKCKLVLVCKAWRRLALQLLYEHIIISSPRKASLVLLVMRRNTPSGNGRSDYGRFTRHIEIYTHARGSSSLSFLHTLFNIFKECPNLRYLSGTWRHQLPVDFVRGVAQVYGRTLQGLYWDDRQDLLLDGPDTTIDSPYDFISSFSNLRILDLRHINASSRGSHLPRPNLPLVQDLILSTHTSSLAVAAALVLPRLTRLTIHDDLSFADDLSALHTFLAKHGHSLTYVDIAFPTSSGTNSIANLPPSTFLQPDVCPNLNTFIFHVSAPVIRNLPSPHQSLKRIGLRGVRSSYLHPDPPQVLRSHTSATSTKDHLFSFTRQMFPSLDIVRTIGFILDADKAGYIKGTQLLPEDLVFWWTDHFAEDDVMFVDGSGAMWMLDPVEEAKCDRIDESAAIYKELETAVDLEEITKQFKGAAFTPEMQKELAHAVQNLLLKTP